MLTKQNPFELLVDSHHGQYVPQVFAETVRRELFGESISAEDWQILSAGPEHEHYWETWESVLNSAETSDGVSLWQDGDLWAVRWSLIGDSEEIGEIGERAYKYLLSIDSAADLIGDLYRGLIDGPSAGRWSEKLIADLREMVEFAADRISADLPCYWHSDFGIEESRVDVEKLLLAESGHLTAISKYW